VVDLRQAELMGYASLKFWTELIARAQRLIKKTVCWYITIKFWVTLGTQGSRRKTVVYRWFMELYFV
jgi:hypothetical protein